MVKIKDVNWVHRNIVQNIIGESKENVKGIKDTADLPQESPLGDL